MADLAEDKVLETVRALIKNEPEQVQQALDALSEGMDVVGERFDTFEYFVGDLIFAGEIFTEVLELLQPLMRVEKTGGEKVILATVEGDLHDLGKKMVKVALEAKHFQVIDLGVNVSPAAILQQTVREKARFVALSAVLSSAIDAMERTIKAFTDAGLREKVTIVIGGACVNESIASLIRADAYGNRPEDTANIFLAAMKKAPPAPQT